MTGLRIVTTWNGSKPQIGKIPVRAGAVDVVYAGALHHAQLLEGEIDRWEQSIDGNPSPAQRDSLELARYALRRWQEAHRLQRTANSVKRLNDMINDHPRLEVTVLAVARANWLKAHRIIGLCAFRRTWCNNIALDAIAAHPILDEKERSPISGLGTGILHHVCAVADSISANAVWGECTQNSTEFYGAFLERQEGLEDLIVLPRSGYAPLKAKIEEKWQSAGRAKSDL